MRTNLPIIRYRILWYSISSVLICIGIVGLALYGLRFGIEFRGGTLMSVVWEGDRPSVKALGDAFAAVNLPGTVVQHINDKETLFRFALVSEEKHGEIAERLRETVGSFREDRFETVGPSIGAELRRKSLWSIGLIILAITVYVAWAFRKVSRPVPSWKYGLMTIVALLHDVFLPIGLFAFLGAFLNVEISTTFIVALLTILGYSVNDTIIVFDRTRENLARYGRTHSFEDIVNMSVNQTLTRSINTSLTTLFALLSIFFFGGETTRYFSLALIVGITFGTYSSIFLASPLLVSAYKRRL